MPGLFVLVHSPSVGPGTWQPVAEVLSARGAGAVVPSLLGVADGEPPYWPRVVAGVNAALDPLPAGRPVVLVPHSNAGLYVPSLVEAAARPVAGCLFVDAGLPGRAGSVPVAPPDLLGMLRGMAGDDGLLPRWTDWYDDADVAPLFPDAATRARLAAERPRLPLAYYEQALPVPPGRDDRPCGYLAFGDAYAAEAADARARGWPVEEMPGLHLHQVVDPAGVADRLLALAAGLGLPLA